MGNCRLLGFVAGLSLLIAGAAEAEDAQIHTVFASYGYAGERKDVKEDVVKYCDGKPSCEFKVSNGSFPARPPADPSPGNDKGLIVAWKCGAVDHKTQFAEGRDATIDCK